MDFLHRNANNQPQTARPAGAQAGVPGSPVSDNTKSRFGGHDPQWLRIIFVVLLFSATVIALAIATLLYFGKDKEAQYVNEDKYQAVFLTNGQVYFAKLGAVNSDYLDLQDIYYLNSQQTENNQQPKNFSLVKLGCELHGPADQMIVNRDQVSFWENLKSDGKVSKAIEQFKSQNPNGQTCSNTNQNSTQQSTETNTTAPQSTAAPTANTTTAPVKKP